MLTSKSKEPSTHRRNNKKSNLNLSFVPSAYANDVIESIDPRMRGSFNTKNFFGETGQTDYIGGIKKMNMTMNKAYTSATNSPVRRSSNKNKYQAFKQKAYEIHQ